MKYTEKTEIRGKKCSCCREPLEKSRIIAAKADNSFLCSTCAKFLKNEAEAFYANLDDGSAAPLLDDKAAGRIAAENCRTIICSNIKQKSGKMTAFGIDKKGICVIELSENGIEDSPQKEFINSSADITVQANVSRRIKERVVVRRSRTAERIYVFCKIGKKDNVTDILKALERCLTDLNEKMPGAMFYMERLTGDTNDLALNILAKTGFKCFYYDGDVSESASYHDGMNKRAVKFGIDFTAKDLYDYCRSRIIGQDEELKVAVYLIMEHIENIAFGVKAPAASWLLTAPSGCGKTEFFRCLKDFFAEHNIPIPIFRQDLSQITETGWKGKEITALIGELKSQTDEKLGNAAICFLDEADKRMTPSYNSKGDVNYNAAMQANLLSMVEGEMMDDGNEGFFDTSGTMFILMGAFQKIRDEKREYGEMLDEIYEEENNGQSSLSDEHFYGDVTLEEIVDFGMIEELAGRLKMVINFHKLPQEHMKEVIVQKCEQISELHRCNVVITDQAVEDFMSVSYTALGIRAAMNKISQLIVKQLADNITSAKFDRIRDTLVIESMEKTSILKNGQRNEVFRYTRN